MQLLDFKRLYDNETLEHLDSDAEDVDSFNDNIVGKILVDAGFRNGKLVASSADHVPEIGT